MCCGLDVSVYCVTQVGGFMLASLAPLKCNILSYNYALTSVRVNIQVPQYNQMPMKVFKNVVDQKDNLSLALQTEYLNGQLFVCELNLLRIFDIIHTEVTAHVNTETEVEEHTSFFFLTHYVSSKTNFMKEYKM